MAGNSNQSVDPLLNVEDAELEDLEDLRVELRLAKVVTEIICPVGDDFRNAFEDDGVLLFLAFANQPLDKVRLVVSEPHKQSFPEQTLG